MDALREVAVTRLAYRLFSDSHSKQSILETGLSATYSSLRRKKIHSLSGDWNLHARFQSEQLRKAEPSFLEGMSLLYGGHLSTASSKPSLALTDTVVFLGLRPAEPRENQVKGKAKA